MVFNYICTVYLLFFKWKGCASSLGVAFPGDWRFSQYDSICCTLILVVGRICGSTIAYSLMLTKQIFYHIRIDTARNKWTETSLTYFFNRDIKLTMVQHNSSLHWTVFYRASFLPIPQTNVKQILDLETCVSVAEDKGGMCNSERWSSGSECW